MSDYKEQISKKRAELKDVFDNPAEDGKYSAEQKMLSKVLTQN